MHRGSGWQARRIRTTPMPNWVKVAIDAWTTPAEIANGHAFRPVIRGDRVCGERLGERVVWPMLREYAAQVGIAGLAPHDLRRTCAKLCRAAGGELEQIQMLLGHASVRTTDDTSGPSRIWFTRRTTRSDSERRSSARLAAT